ncbi:MAG TPA: hypothetical protein K8V15_03755 [Tessaracoccus flavescens]|uniref:Uncharacterized protein n=1 Tax=Tessaracoccus flavescens TaxID=399497 RepID=A0A921JR45_9ACTN|nr:hypothetical protein [Tessaracoccus flavescens]
MIWVAVVGGLALAGLIALVIYGVGLKSKAEALQSEARQLQLRAQEMKRLIGEVQQALPMRD